MYNYQVTKYNPENRDISNTFSNNEWTSIADIGTSFNGTILTFQVYKNYEDAYIEIIERIMRKNGTQKFLVVSLEQYNDNISLEKIMTLKDGDLNYTINLKAIIRLILRELIWCKLESEFMSVHFGYDFYMYIKSSVIINEKKFFFNDINLYIENCISPYDTKK